MKALRAILLFVVLAVIGVIGILASPLGSHGWSVALCVAWLVVASKVVAVTMAMRQDRQRR